jgi:Tol biopolymer transport system component
MGCRAGGCAAALLSFLLWAPGTAAAQFERLSVSSTGAQGDDGSFGAATSADGRFTAFISRASNLVAGDTNGRCDAFVRDAQAGTTERMSLTAAGDESAGGVECFVTPAISGDGRRVVFVSSAADLVAGDSGGWTDVFVRDRAAGTTTRVSETASGEEAQGNSLDPAISEDGHAVAFASNAPNLVPGAAYSLGTLYARDLTTGAVEWVAPRDESLGGTGSSYQPSLSADGRFVAFGSNDAGLVDGDTNLRPDVFVRDRALDATTRVSVDSEGGEADHETSFQGSGDPAISADGRYVAFTSDARDLVPDVTTTPLQVYVRDRSAGVTTIASVNAAGDEGFGGDSVGPSISANGRIVAFHTEANNLYPGHVFGSADIVVRDTVAGTTRALTVAPGSDQSSFSPSLSADGSLVAFASLAPLLAADTNGLIDVYRRPVAGGDSTPPAVSLPGDLSVPATSPAGAEVQYTVTAEDDTDPEPAIACEPPSGSTFPIGDTTVDCTATDAAGNKATGSFTVHVSGAGEQLDELQALIATADLSTSVRRNLGAKLEATETSLATGDVQGACEALKAFVASVNAQSGKQLTADLAAVLLERAGRIRAVLACG